MDTLEHTDPLAWASADPLLSAAEAEWFAKFASSEPQRKKDRPLKDKKRTDHNEDRTELCECEECKT